MYFTNQKQESYLEQVDMINYLTITFSTMMLSLWVTWNELAILANELARLMNHPKQIEIEKQFTYL